MPDSSRRDRFFGWLESSDRKLFGCTTKHLDSAASKSPQEWVQTKIARWTDDWWLSLGPLNLAFNFIAAVCLTIYSTCDWNPGILVWVASFSYAFGAGWILLVSSTLAAEKGWEFPAPRYSRLLACTTIVLLCICAAPLLHFLFEKVSNDDGFFASIVIFEVSLLVGFAGSILIRFSLARLRTGANWHDLLDEDETDEPQAGDSWWANSLIRLAGFGTPCVAVYAILHCVGIASWP